MNGQKNISPIDNSQKAKIHIAKAQMNLDRQQYEDILSGFIGDHGLPCTSCTELNHDQAEALLIIFRKLGWKETRSKKVLKYEEYANRDSNYATPKSMRLIDALWHTSPNVREKTDDAMNKFLLNRGFANHITFLLAKDVKKVVEAIKHL